MSEEQTSAAQEAARTGVPAVDAVLDEVEAAAELPLEQQVAVFERAHEQLRRALDAPVDDQPGDAGEPA